MDSSGSRVWDGQPGFPPPLAIAARYDVAPMHVQQLMEQQVQEELRKSAKRAANRRSASTCRARKKFLVETIAEANERMRKRSRVLSLLPDMIMAMGRDGVVTYASENCRQFLKYTREEVEGANIFDLVEVGSHDRLRRLMEENLGSVSKEAIASALRFQDTTLGALFARSEKLMEEENAGVLGAGGGFPRALAPLGRRGRNGSFSGGSSGGMTSGAPDLDSSADDAESEATTSTRQGSDRANGFTSVGGAGRNTGVSNAGDGSSGMYEDTGASLREKRKVSASLGSTAFTGTQPEIAARNVRVKAEGAAAFCAPKRGSSGGSTAVTDASVASTTGSGAGKGGPRQPLLGLQGLPSGLTVRTYDLAAELPGGIGNGTIASVDRELQSKINAFTNNRKDMCKLEIMRQDGKSDWYEVRSSMRLVWLKAKQDIVPVEVICSFQRMHTDNPEQSTNSIVARLQRAAAMVRSLPTESNGDSSQSVGGFSMSGTSAGGDSGTSPSSSNGDGDGNSEGVMDGDGDDASSSDSGGGASSGSNSGNGSGNGSGDVSSNVSGNGSRRDNGERGDTVVDTRPSWKKSKRVCPPTPKSQEDVRDFCIERAVGIARAVLGAGSDVAGETRGISKRTEGRTEPRPVETTGSSGHVGPRESALGCSAAAGEHMAPRLPPTARRLATSAKKSILFRHGFHSQP